NENLPGMLACIHCGAVLTGASRDMTMTMPAVNLEDALSIPITQPLQPDADRLHTASMLSPDMLEFYVGTSDLPLHVHFTDAVLTLGRQSPTSLHQPQVDLSSFDGQALGVSRQHAVIRKRPTGFTLTDLGSSNGTTLNEVMLRPAVEYPLKPGDQIRLGQLALEIYFNDTLWNEDADLDEFFVDKAIFRDKSEPSA
ncbi:MAG TPA: FHA domain-containing protein, partial [Aggregatilineales bacterium]|nr:FHA domain-containing protein [Aggregatilineales bacterium]